MSYSPTIAVTSTRYKPHRDPSGATVYGTIVLYTLDGEPCSAHFNEQLTMAQAAQRLRAYDRYRRPPR